MKAACSIRELTSAVARRKQRVMNQIKAVLCLAKMPIIRNEVGFFIQDIDSAVGKERGNKTRVPVQAPTNSHPCL
jgi:hypothetical protein